MRYAAFPFAVVIMVTAFLSVRSSLVEATLDLEHLGFRLQTLCLPAILASLVAGSCRDAGRAMWRGAHGPTSNERLKHAICICGGATRPSPGWSRSGGDLLVTVVEHMDQLRPHVHDIVVPEVKPAKGLRIFSIMPASAPRRIARMPVESRAGRGKPTMRR